MLDFFKNLDVSSRLRVLEEEVLELEDSAIHIKSLSSRVDKLEAATGGVWKTKCGDVVRIRDMSTGHIEACIKGGYAKPGGLAYNDMKAELRRRDEDAAWRRAEDSSTRNQDDDVESRPGKRRYTDEHGDWEEDLLFVRESIGRGRRWVEEAPSVMNRRQIVYRLLKCPGTHVFRTRQAAEDYRDRFAREFKIEEVFLADCYMDAAIGRRPSPASGS